MPFVSKAQWRYMFMMHPLIAEEMAQKTLGGPIIRYRRLPEHKGVGPLGKGSLRDKIATAISRSRKVESVGYEQRREAKDKLKSKIAATTRKVEKT